MENKNPNIWGTGGERVKADRLAAADQTETWPVRELS